MSRRLKWPLSRDGGPALVTLEADELPEVTQAVHILIRTRKLSRPLSPEIGLDDPTFAASVDADEIEGAVAEWEPRATAHVVTTPSADGRSVVRSIHVGLADSPQEV